MIHIEVIKSNDPLALGKYEFNFNEVSVGRSIKNDLIFSDSNFPNFFFSIKFIQGQLIIQAKKTHPFFFLNGKKVAGSLKLHIGDHIAFGGNQFVVKAAQYTIDEPDIATLYEKFQNETPELQFVLNFIEDVFIEIEKGNRV